MPGYDFDSLFREDEGEWAGLNPQPSDTRVIPNIPAGSVGNDQLSGNISPLKLQAVVIKVTQTAGQVVTTGTETVVAYATEALNQGFVPLDTSARTVALPYSGMYLATIRGQWASSGTGRRRLTLQIASADTDIQDHQHVGNTVTHVSGTTGVFEGTAGSLIRVRAFQTSGGDLSLDDSQMSLIFLGPV